MTVSYTVIVCENRFRNPKHFRRGDDAPRGLPNRAALPAIFIPKIWKL